jgi:hypothetical protein
MNSDTHDKFANPKYTREELRAMARAFLAEYDAPDSFTGFNNSVLLQMRLLLATNVLAEQQIALIREMAQ